MKLAETIALVEPAIAAADAEAASRLFFEALRPLGAISCQTRLYQRPPGVLTSERHWQAGGFVARIAPDGWIGSPGFNYICFDCNPLLGSVVERRTRYRFSDFAPRGDRRFGTYWEAFSEAGIGDGLCANAYRGQRGIASLHLGFPTADFDRAFADAVHMAGLILTEHLLDCAGPQEEPFRLTPRERDVLAYVAEGKSDWEISRILSLSEATVRTHVDHARLKLDAVNRTQAVAKLVRAGLI